MNQRSETVVDAAETANIEIFSRGLLRRLLLPGILAVLIYGALLFYADAEAIVRHTGEVSLGVLVLGTALACGNFVVRFFRWQFYLSRLDIRVKLGESALVFVSGFAMSITPGKVGELVKSLLLKESHSIPVARSGPIVLAERVTDLAGLLLLGAIGLFAVPNGTILAIASVVMVVFLFAVCTWRALGNVIIAAVSRVPKAAAFRGKLQTAYDALLTLAAPWPFFVGVVTSVIAWGFQCVSLNVFAWAFPAVSLSLQHGLVAYSAPLLLGTLAFLPGGLGVTEASMAGVLRHLGGPGMTPSVAAAVTILVRLASFWLAIALGFLALALWRARRRRETEQVLDNEARS